MPRAKLHIEKTLKPVQAHSIGRASGLSRAFPWLQISPPRMIDWKHFDLTVEGLSPELQGMRVTHLTDFHFRKSWHAGYEALIEQLNANPPDLLLLTGDFVDSKRNAY